MSITDNAGALGAWSENAAFWIKIIQERLDRYRTELTDARVLAALGDVADKDILDAGCGEGYLVRELARRGANAVGVDFCPELIEAARSTSARENLQTSFEVADMLDLPFPDNKFDVVLSNHSINDIGAPHLAFAEFARVLRPHGETVILMLHPCFFSWGRQENDTEDVNYSPDRVGAKPYNVAGIESPAVATAHVATLETYTTGLIDCGFVITGLWEPRPTEEQVATDVWWRERSQLPRFMLIKARLG